MKTTRTPRSIAITLTLALPLAAQTHKTQQQPTDWQIEAEVQSALASEHAFRGSSILSSVNAGMVLLSGNVRSDAEKALATSELGTLKGVKSVTNNLAVVDNSFHAPAPPPPAAAGCPHCEAW